MKPSLVDAHNHLQDPVLAPHLEQVLEDQVQDGVVAQVINGTSECDWRQVQVLCARVPGAVPAYGLHPWLVGSETGDWQQRLIDYVEDGDCSIGEIGLDRWLRTDNFEEQVAAFRWQWRLASERELAVTVHCLRAWDVLEREVDQLPRLARGFLLHAYGGSSDRVQRWVERGAYFSFSPTFGIPGRGRKLEPFRVIPDDRLLVESDAPAMALPDFLATRVVTHGGGDQRINHPSNVAVGYGMLQSLRDGDLPDLVANFDRLFGRSRKPGSEQRVSP